MTVAAPSTTRALAAARGAADLALVLAPDRVRQLVAPASPTPRWLVRLLGTRVVLQQLVVLAAPSRRTVLLGAGIDALHAASMVAAARHWPAHRRPALLSGAVAAASAVLAVATAPPPPGD